MPSGRMQTLTRDALVVAYDASERDRGIVAEAWGEAGPLLYLSDAVSPEARARMLQSAAAVFAQHTGNDFRREEWPLLAGARLLQMLPAGVDFMPLRGLPPELPVAGNGGASAEPMAEHGAAMALAAAKRLFAEHAELRAGRFNQFRPNIRLAGGVCGILGFGGIGVAVARLMRAFGMRIHAINRRGASDEPSDWIATPDRLDEMCSAADILFITAPLSTATEKMIGAGQLRRMKDDAILVNLARGEIIDERALYDHLAERPSFTACLDAWWVEPVRHGSFRIDTPLLDLPNVIGSPHNSASVGSSRRPVVLRRAIANCLRAVRGETPLHLIRREERML